MALKFSGEQPSIGMMGAIGEPNREQSVSGAGEEGNNMVGRGGRERRSKKKERKDFLCSYSA